MADIDCDEVLDLLGAAVDRELPAAAQDAVTRHVAACAACARELRALGTLRAEVAALRGPGAPPHLAGAIRQALPLRHGAVLPGRRRGLELAAAGIAGLLLGGAGVWWSRPSPEGGVIHDLFTAHARALLAGTPLQIASADSHVVRPWLSARLPWATRAGDQTEFPLQGARLDLVGGQMVAALVYRRREHVVTVFSAPADGAQGWPREAAARRGLRLLPWVFEGVHYIAVSDLNAREMGQLATLLAGGG